MKDDIAHWFLAVVAVSLCIGLYSLMSTVKIDQAVAKFLAVWLGIIWMGMGCILLLKIDEKLKGI